MSRTMPTSLGSRVTADRVAPYRLPGYAGVVAIDDAGTVEFVSPEFDGMLGYRIDELLGRSFLDFVHAEDIGQAVESFGGVGGRPGYHQALEFRITNGADVMSVDVVADNRLDDPNLGVVLLHLADPLDRRRSVQLLARQAEIMRQIALGGSLESAVREVLSFVEAALPGFRCAGFLVDDDRIVLATSSSLDAADLEMIGGTLLADGDGIEPQSALADGETHVARDLDEPQWASRRESAPPGARCLWSVPVRLDRTTPVHGCIELFGPDSLHPRDEDWTVLRLAGRLVAIAVDHARTQEQLIHDAELDPLTGIPNRRVITGQIARMLERGDDGRAVCFIDLDRLKVVNDALGHDAGDVLIREAGDRLTAAVGADGVVGRFGGDEFVAIARSEAIGAESLAQRCLDAFARPIMIGGRNWFLSASIGVVVVDDQRTASEVLRDADTAMYEAKRAGRGCWRRFQTSDRELVRRRMQLEQRLAEGIRYGGVSAWFQPVVDARDWSLVATEALARWEIEPNVWVPPVEFIPLAEELGLIDELGDLMLRQSRRGRTELVEVLGREITMTINVSPIQVRSDALFEQLASLRAGGEPGRFCLEMTEQHMIDDTSDTIERLERLVGLGVRLAVDDFGTGYSSLAMLHQAPVEVLKIDRRLVSQVADPSGRAVLSAVVGVAKAYGMRTVAEGVETIDEAVALRDLGVDALQGYLFAPPEPMSCVIRRISRQDWPWDVPADALALMG